MHINSTHTIYFMHNGMTLMMHISMLIAMNKAIILIAKLKLTIN